MRSSRTWLTSGQVSVHDKLLEEVQNQLVELKGMAERNKSSESGEVIPEERVQQHAEEEIAGERICEQIHDISVQHIQAQIAKVVKGIPKERLRSASSSHRAYGAGGRRHCATSCGQRSASSIHRASGA